MTSSPHWIEPVLARYERPLLQYAASIAGDGAPDVVQDTFLRLAENGPLDSAHVAPWLFTVCRNRALDCRRKERKNLPMNPEIEEISLDPGPDAQLETKEASLILQRLLTRLPDNQREIVRLRFQCDLSYKEISAVTRLGESNVGFLLHTAIKTLRQLWPQTEEPTL